MWLSEHPDVELQTVPADMVMASGSGLDPDITLDNALFQLDRVAAAWAKKTNKDEAQVHSEIEKLLRDNSTSPLGGTVGVPLVNVLETNLALRLATPRNSQIFQFHSLNEEDNVIAMPPTH